MTVHQALHLAQKLAPLDRELLLASVLDQDRAKLLTHPEQKMSPGQTARFLGLVKRREKHEPLAYILGEKEFYGRVFSVSQSTLIPRPETELLVETVLAHLRTLGTRKNIAVVDIGTGSGCIIVSLAKEYEKSKNIFWFATDISGPALVIAKKNARQHSLHSIVFKKGDLLSPIKKKLQNFNEIILVANLPYLSRELYQSAPRDVRSFEPQSALVSGPCGLNHYKRLLAELRLFRPSQKVSFFLEISPEQTRLLKKVIGQKTQIVCDLTGRDRIITNVTK